MLRNLVKFTQAVSGHMGSRASFFPLMYFSSPTLMYTVLNTIFFGRSSIIFVIKDLRVVVVFRISSKSI